MEHKEGLQLDLQVFVSGGVASVYTRVSELNTNIVALMGVVFDHVQSPEEREIAALVGSHTVDTQSTLQDESTLNKILVHVKEARARKYQGSNPAFGIHDAEAAEGTTTALNLQQELNKDVDDVIMENQQPFESKFAATIAHLEEISVTIQRESNRVIGAIQGGPHEEIVDTVCLRACYLV